MRDRLIELLDTFSKKELGANFNRDILGKFADYLLADGWFRPPCKVGAKVFFVHETCDENANEYLVIDTGKVISFSLQENGLWMYCRYKTGLTYWHKVDSDFGTEVFLTREDAEQKLKKEGV